MRERKGKFQLVRIDRMDVIRSQLSFRWVIYFETIQVLDAMPRRGVVYISVGGRHDPTLVEIYGTEKSALLPLAFSRCVVFFFLFSQLVLLI